MQMKKNHLVKSLSLALLFAFFALTSYATPPKPSYLDPIRWWDQDQQDPIRELAIETPEQLAARVPKRTDPKIVLLMYHNIVFGRTGGEYNRDLYNFEHDLVFLRNRTQIIDTAKSLGYWGIRSSTTGAMIPGTIDMFNIPAFYMTNERADILAQQIYAKLLGR